MKNTPQETQYNERLMLASWLVNDQANESNVHIKYLDLQMK
jgi:hypothetical protein